MNQPEIILQQAELFQGLDPDQIKLVAAVCHPESFAPGALILQAGAHSDDLYIIADGAVSVVLPLDAIPIEAVSPTEFRTTSSGIQIACLQRGQSFGEIALVDQGIRSANVYASNQPVNLLSIPRQDLLDLCEAHPQLGYRLLYNLAADLALKIRSTDIWVQREQLTKPR